MSVTTYGSGFTVFSQPSNFTAQTFTAAFPEFGDPASYPTTAVNFWVNIANQSVDQIRFGQWGELCVYLYAAHMLTLARRAVLQQARGGVPGQAGGMLSSKSVGGGSLSYDTGSVAEQNGGHWNMTDYGVRYLAYARMAGMGGVQIGYGPMPLYSGDPWFGPLT